MLYDKSLEKDNCGFGLIAHIEGEPSHKVVRTAIHALRMTRKPRRHALGVPVRNGPDGNPSEPGEVH